jgi:hypothetical protein
MPVFGTDHAPQKSAFGSLISFCGTGVKKTSDTKFEMSKTNFVPDGDLAVLILKKMAP